MPVITGEALVRVISATEREAVALQLNKELAGNLTADGPTIFEIPLQGTDRFDVLVVWDRWEPFGSQDRSDVIAQAYQAQKPTLKIAQALGTTYQEAIEQQLLPYVVKPMARDTEADFEVLRQAMRQQGAFQLRDGEVDLRLPTWQLAEAVFRKLSEKHPEGYWAIVQTVASITD